MAGNKQRPTETTLLRFHLAAYQLGTMGAGFEKTDFVLVSEIYAFPCAQPLVTCINHLTHTRAIAVLICSRCHLLLFFWTLPTASSKLLALPLT